MVIFLVVFTFKVETNVDVMVVLFETVSVDVFSDSWVVTLVFEVVSVDVVSVDGFATVKLEVVPLFVVLTSVEVISAEVVDL